CGRSYAAGGGRDEYGEECCSALPSVSSRRPSRPVCWNVTVAGNEPATRTAECNSGHTEQCRASFSNPSGWKCNACAAAEPNTSTRQAITSQGGIQRAMLPCLCFITVRKPDYTTCWVRTSTVWACSCFTRKKSAFTPAISTSTAPKVHTMVAPVGVSKSTEQ